MSEVSGWESGLATHSGLKKWKNSRHNKNSKICEIINIINSTTSQNLHLCTFLDLLVHCVLTLLVMNHVLKIGFTGTWNEESSEIMRSILKTHLSMAALPKPETRFSCTLSITNYYICTKYICICIYILPAFFSVSNLKACRTSELEGQQHVLLIERVVSSILKNAQGLF